MDIRPNWDEIALGVDESLPREVHHQFWLTQCNQWLNAIGAYYDSGYKIYESDNFCLLTNESQRYVDLFLAFLERSLKRILTSMDGITSDEGFGKHVAIVFADDDQYYDYVMKFFPEEGEFGLSSGMFINEGYGHFAFPSQEITYAEPIAVHELTHACLAHLDIPVWLNEGLAVMMEEVHANNPLYLDQEIFDRHHRYWNKETIEGFWNGESFTSSGEESELSYNLAHILVKNLSKDYSVFSEFVNAAKSEDGGEAACQQYLSVGLISLAEGFIR